MIMKYQAWDSTKSHTGHLSLVTEDKDRYYTLIWTGILNWENLFIAGFLLPHTVFLMYIYDIH